MSTVSDKVLPLLLEGSLFTPFEDRLNLIRRLSGVLIVRPQHLRRCPSLSTALLTALIAVLMFSFDTSFRPGLFACPSEDLHLRRAQPSKVNLHQRLSHAFVMKCRPDHCSVELGVIYARENTVAEIFR